MDAANRNGGDYMANTELRAEIQKSRLRQWEIAAFIGVSEYTLVRWLRTELPPDKQAAILEAIEKLKHSD